MIQLSQHLQENERGHLRVFLYGLQARAAKHSPDPHQPELTISESEFRGLRDKWVYRRLKRHSNRRKAFEEFLLTNE